METFQTYIEFSLYFKHYTIYVLISISFVIVKKWLAPRFSAQQTLFSAIQKVLKAKYFPFKIQFNYFAFMVLLGHYNYFLTYWNT